MPLSKKNVQLVFTKIKTLRQYIKQQMSKLLQGSVYIYLYMGHSTLD